MHKVIMEQDHNANNKSDEEDSNLPPLTKWEGFYWDLDARSFPLTTGHRSILINNYLITHGGFSGLYSNKTYKLDLDTLEWHTEYHNKVFTPPEFKGRQWHSLVQYKNKLYTFGGAIDEEPHQFGDIFEYDPATWRWQKIEVVFDQDADPSKVPIARYVHSAVVFENGMYIYGGKTDLNGTALTLADLWRFDLDTHKWTKLEPTGDVPVARRAHLAITYDRKMLVFGGWNGEDHFNDAYYYHFKKNQWTKIDQKGDVPPPRQLPTAVIRGEKMIVFGGKETRPEDPTNSVYTGDLYEFNFGSNTWKKLDVEGSNLIARGGHSMCEYNNYLYVLGGYDGNRKDELWRLKLPEAEPVHEKVRDITSQLKSDLKMIYQLKEYSDLVVEIDGQSYNLHSTLLSVRCPKLFSLIQNNEIQAQNISKNQMNILVEYIYEERFNTFRSRTIYLAEAAEMYELATELDLPYLSSVIEEATMNILEQDNLMEAGATFKTPRIHKRCLELATEMIAEQLTLNFDMAFDDEPTNVTEPNLTQNLLELLRTEANSDITIIVDEQQFKLHKFILYRRCPFFKGFSEFNQRISGCALVHKPQMPLTAFKSLLQYIYGASIHCESIEDYFWLLQEASYYMIDDKYYYQNIADLISENITVDNAAGLLRIADKFQFNGIEDIKQAIRAVMQ